MAARGHARLGRIDRKSTRLNSSHAEISTLSLHDALPIWEVGRATTHSDDCAASSQARFEVRGPRGWPPSASGAMFRPQPNRPWHADERGTQFAGRWPLAVTLGWGE